MLFPVVSLRPISFLRRIDAGRDVDAELLTGAVSRHLQLQKIAPEFYLTLKHHTSWCYVIWSFLTDPEVCPLLVLW
jgi:hypothetical protein